MIGILNDNFHRKRDDRAERLMELLLAARSQSLSESLNVYFRVIDHPTRESETEHAKRRFACETAEVFRRHAYLIFSDCFLGYYPLRNHRISMI